MKKNHFESGIVSTSAIDIEEVVLGAILIEKHAMLRVQDILHSEHFYKEKHIIIFRAIENLARKNTPIDILTVVHELKITGHLEIIGGAYEVSILTNRVANSENIEHHVRILHQCFINRKLQELGHFTTKDAQDNSGDVIDKLEKLNKRFMEIFNIFRGKRSMGARKIAQDTLKSIIATKNGDSYPALPTGFPSLDDKIIGLKKGDLIIIGARPSMGKTAFAINIAKYLCQTKNVKGAVFSLEMRARQLMYRLIAEDVEINVQLIEKGHLTANEIDKISNAVNAYTDNMLIDDNSSLTVLELKVRAMRMKAEHGIKFIIIDYLQLISGPSKKYGSRENDISEISRGLKILAKDLDIPIIALSQLSREAEKRPNRKPQLADLRESGAIEQDADIVLFLYRPDYYGMRTDKEGNNLEGAAEIIIAKQRSGSLGSIHLHFIKEWTKFVELDSLKMPTIIEKRELEQESEPF